MLKIVAWNTQGDKWNSLMNDRIAPLLQNGTDDVLGLTCESGWGPWVEKTNVSACDLYPLEGTFRWQTPAPQSLFVQGMRDQIEHNRNVHVGWIPWVPYPSAINDSARTNSRCSMGVTWLPTRSSQQSFGMNWHVFRDQIPYPAKRPYVRFTVKRGDNPCFVVIFAHLISGWPTEATRDVTAIFTIVRAMVPEGMPALLLGDLNIDLLTQIQLDRLTRALPAKWRLLRTSRATHRSEASGRESELDFGVLYDPHQHYAQARAMWGPQWKTATNGSDHAVVTYEITIVSE
jgi:hypothetical protein